ncbi:hypothetical protein J7T55_014843 [Diaporthe amygdali]|uniref:uncharacterized protein n=1 Tax=Phomopsis amygdali TaxID=1214568 RepID=UPI0022FF0CAE|nr:uncharacterized protein J7T55_014843 [Diaporthe amygdali]KAJ0110040.1 hypothetical protein J7T55_014843 [Diaporthe amygdali]
MSVFGGLDLCLFPAGTPPDGVKSNFTNPPTYAPVVIAVTVVVLFFASLFTGCRLLANWKKLTWTDHCNTLALIFSLAQSGLMLAHMFGTSGTYQRVGFSEIMPNQQMMLVPGLIFSKVSLFLLFLQIFDIRDVGASVLHSFHLILDAYIEAISVVELNIAIIVCSVPGLAKFFRTYAADWTPIESLRSKFFSPGNSSNSSGSNLYNKHGWPAARQAEQKPDPHVESATSQSTSASLHRGGIDESHEYVDLQERWQIDPYLDTRGPEYSWMYMKNEMNGVSIGRSSQEKAHAFHSGQGA